MINILAVSDEEVLRDKEITFPRIDLLLGCGDLSPGYMEFLIDRYRPPGRIMTHGNHDDIYFQDSEPVNMEYSRLYCGMFTITEGIHTISKDDLPESERDLHLAAYSGACAYGDRPFYFSENDAASWIRNLKWKDFFGNVRMDIMISHTPPALEGVPYIDFFHRPSKNLAQICERFSPSLWFYGHIHSTYTDKPLDFYYEDTQTHLLNASPFKFIQYDESSQKSHIPEYDWNNIYF
ncbi:MAG: metallophosphoesterase [Candidatus Woesearchaeota archaeon]